MMNYSKTLIFSLLILGLWNCAKESAAPQSPATTGTAGSYATFMVVGDFLYVVDDQNINTLSLEDPSEPVLVNTQEIGERIESIFNLDSRLFIGSGSGLYIYTIQDNGIPTYNSHFSYDIFPIYPCDPVVANDSFAFVTLNTSITSTSCRVTNTTQVNELAIFDITDVANPLLINEYPLSGPKGVGLDGNTLFVCDDLDGLKIFDVTNKLDIQMIDHIADFQAYDVIPLDGLLLVVGPKHLFQFDYTDLSNIKEVSRISIEP